MPTPLSQLFHLHSRFGFGLTYPQAKELGQKTLNENAELLAIASATGSPLTNIGKDDVPLRKEAIEGGMSPREFHALLNEKAEALNIAWIKKLLETKNVLLEKQTLFWHSHFACRVKQPYLLQELNNIHRRFAFSSFRDLLVEVCKSPAMLLYLNNQQNRKEHPNENFARELMELFTLGRGHYSEQDVQEAARAFTGWAFNKDGQFEFREKHHDAGSKTIFDRSGNFGGEDVINMLLSNKQTAHFLCRKLYKYYVNETVNEAHVKELAEFYYQSQYNTGSLLKKIMSSSWFYAPENMGCNIKPPIDYLVGLSRTFNITWTNYKVLFQLQRALGQQLFYPPNVAGWPGGRYFIDNQKLLLRMKLPSVILNNGELEVSVKPDDPDDAVKQEAAQETVLNKKFETEVNWAKIISDHQALEPDKLMKSFLLKQPAPQVADMIRNDATSNVKETILKIVSLPDYNLA